MDPAQAASSKKQPEVEPQNQSGDTFVPSQPKKGFVRSAARELAFWSRKLAVSVASIPAALFGVGMGLSPAKLTGADKLHKMGIDGQGTKIAIMDMNFTKFGSGDEDVVGVYRVQDGAMEKGLKKSKADIVQEIATRQKGFSFHGNAMACIVTGESMGLTGVAPGAEVLGVSIVDQDKKLQPELFVDGLKWILENHEEQNITAVSASVNYFRPTDEQRKETQELVEQLKTAGIPVMVAAGNSGPGEDSIRFPADLENIVSLGAYTPGWSGSNYDDRLDRYSARGGPEKSGPKLIAPGGDIFTKDNHGGVELTKGTSNSPPMVSSSYALLTQAFPNATYDDKMSALFETAEPLTGDVKQEGFGALRLNAAYQKLADSQ